MVSIPILLAGFTKKELSDTDVFILYFCLVSPVSSTARCGRPVSLMRGCIMLYEYVLARLRYGSLRKIETIDTCDYEIPFVRYCS
jgi:hypothetical protein